MKRRTNFGSWATGQFKDVILGVWRRATDSRASVAKMAIFGVAGLGMAGLGVVSQAGALTYQSEVTQEFTFNPTISVSLSSPNLVINDLAPGTYADSNIITVTTSTNSAGGYTLGASVGNSSYPTRNLTQSGISDNFASIAENASQSQLTTPNTWGYAMKDGDTSNSSTWSTYSGLPLYDSTDVTNTKILVPTTGERGEDTISFKIAAYADSTIAGGTYNNVINFTAVANPTISTLYMQDVGTWASTVEEGKPIQVVDRRDDKTYWVARLADGNIWMTQNLDHDIVTTSNFYTYANTDIGHGSTPNTSATWTASTATYATGVTTWNSSRVNPESYDPGNVCWDGTMNDDWDGTLDTETVSCSASDHYHIGNYYNWTAAVAMNDSSSYTTNLTDVDQSICPAGWRLPVYSGSKSYDTLVSTLNLTAGSEASAGADGNIQDSPVYFPYAGDWVGVSEGVGSWSYYWSSVVRDSSLAYELDFDVYGSLGPQNDYGRDYGVSVRCVAR